MSYRFLPAARAELDDAALWYEQRVAGMGVRFSAAANATVRAVVQSPSAFGRVPRSPRRREVRELKVRRFSYKIVYEVRPAEVVVLSVQHTSSRRQPWRRRLGP